MSIAPDFYDGFTQDADRDRLFVAASVLTSLVDPYTLAASVGGDRDVVPAMIAGATWSRSVLGKHHLR